MSVTLQQEAAEAINGGLHGTGLFEALGNSEGGRVDWWFGGMRGTLKQMRVSVARSSLADAVLVTVEWPAPNPEGGMLRGQQTWTVPTGDDEQRGEVINSTAEVVIKVLQLYRDIYQGTASSAEAITAARPDDTPEETA